MGWYEDAGVDLLYPSHRFDQISNVSRGVAVPRPGNSQINISGKRMFSFSM
jgi:hypothetical protein